MCSEASTSLVRICSRETKISKILQSHVGSISRHHQCCVYLRRKFSWKIHSAATRSNFSLLNFIRHAADGFELDPRWLGKSHFFLAVINIIMLQCSRPLQTLSLFCGDDRVPCDAIMACSSINDFWGLDGSDHLHPEQPFAASLPQSSFKFLSPESSDEYLNEPGIIHNGVIFDWRRSSLKVVVKGRTLILRNSFRCKNEASYLKLR